MIDGLYTLREILAPAEQARFAVAAFCIWNAESADAVLAAAQAEQAPVILMVGPPEAPLLGLDNYARLVRLLAGNYEVPVCLHLDHSVRAEMAEQALQAGFPSVMLDYSDRPLQENLATTRAVVESARRTGASVEAEIGHVGRADGTSNEVMTAQTFLTEPEEAAHFAAATQVDALAVSVGTAHGLGPGLPVLDFDRLAEINRRVAVPLVLYGGTGRCPEQVRRAISLGVRKVNIASDLNRVFVQTMAQALRDGQGYFWHATALREMKSALQALVQKHLRLVGASGKAGLYRG
jgi:fructose-bisphosphate aldolase class II